jgi:hypothetical protein
VFIPVVPGDVVDVQTFKKRKAYYEGKRFIFMNFHVSCGTVASTLAFVVVVSGKYELQSAACFKQNE